MKFTWLGQAGLLIEEKSYKILVDPYLSNSVAKINPKNDRRIPVDERFLQIKPDMLVFTHNHLDHYDPETVQHYLGEDTAVTVLAPRSVWEEVRKHGGNNNYVLFNRHTRWTEGGITFTAVLAAHSDTTPIGVILNREYYITGDTLYNEDIFEDLPEGLKAVFLPINGVGNNMNMTDAADFAKRTGAEKVVPLHWGLFDDLDPADFICENKVIPTIYKEIVL
ncbi:MAG: MBL fold metallo-hydrolase [Clostridia bacterium]|nr:MBL fold metallo-hydrolase [Clostridia bacterium]